MEWLTREQVEKAAKKSRKAAIECSREHWRQLSMATAKEMRECESPLSGEYEALCCMAGPGNDDDPSCTECPLAVVNRPCPVEDSLFRTAFTAWDEWHGKTGHFQVWKSAARRMYQVLLACK